jgi:HEAT repeat protein
VQSAHVSPQTRRKETARALLARFDLDAVTAWAEGEPQAVRVLQQLLFDQDELASWRAVEGLGRAAAVLARRGLEPARELLRRVLWLMNDESGGLLWYAPQVMAAVIANVPALAREFGDILASFLEEEPFRTGTRWGLWRISGTSPEVIRAAAVELGASLQDPDPAVRGHAVLALRAAGAAVPDVAGGDRGAFAFFDPRIGEMRSTTVADAARGAP